MKEVERFLLNTKIRLTLKFSFVIQAHQGLYKTSNHIVRQALPKSSDLTMYPQEELSDIGMGYHRAPRRSLNDYPSEEIMKKATGLESLIPIV